ncbi:hypothetical protein [Bradyrhizobium archetypum]|uniref:Uncharacterized protein n=1 Tax=Bradyrhizobium archetypum TaxID=2721160 RepID=A0A7Y4M318_9BRAD|nr:hypothetical protein [Bradyrhizobium archetypum]NOJ48313.1 hypothetical protein [Bradyrhizobium archetypum]
MGKSRGGSHMRHKSNDLAGISRPTATNPDHRAGKPSLTVFCCNRALSRNVSAGFASLCNLDSWELSL